MPRYHVIIKDTRLDEVKAEMEFTPEQDGNDVLVTLHAPDEQTAENAVVPRLPTGRKFKVKGPTQVP